MTDYFLLQFANGEHTVTSRNHYKLS